MPLPDAEVAEVAELPGANLPADHGLASLGLILQLGGTLFAAYSAILAFLGIAAFGGSGASTLWVVVVLGLGVARALVHRAAGTQLLYGTRNAAGESTNAFGGIRRYIVVGGGHAVVTGLLLTAKLGVELELAGAIALGLLVWPVVLAVVVSLPRFRRCAHRLPVSEDKGFEGAALLMTMLGLCGAFATGTIVFGVVGHARASSGSFLLHGPGFLVLLALVMLGARSLVHVQAGLSGLRETSVDRAVELVHRYANFGVISAFATAGAMVLLMMMERVDVFGLAMIAGGCWMLMAWPLIVRRFFSDRQFAELLAGDAAAVHRRAPDAGLTGLGWFLIAQAALGATLLLPQLALRDTVGDAPAELMVMGQFGLLSGGGFDGSLWWSVGLLVLQVWAGVELVAMRPHHRVIASMFGVVSSAVSIWLLWPVLSIFAGAERALLGNEQLVFAIAPLAMQLVVPIATVILINRTLTPTARATYRRPPQAAGS